jgi:hypothetical protein
LASNIAHGNQFETAWCLVVSGVLQIPLEEEDLQRFDDRPPEGIIFAILGLMREHHLLSCSLSRWPWRSRFSAAGIHSDNWLPFYEAVRRKWTEDKRLIAAVKADPVLEKMLSAGVTFMEDRLFHASYIDVKRRTFRTWSNVNQIEEE